MGSEAGVSALQEYVTGGELYDHVNKKDRLDEDEARHFFRQLLAATAVRTLVGICMECPQTYSSLYWVQYMHSAGVVHRDLKPENCLLDGFGNIKVIDFGLGNFFRADDSSAMLKTFCGTPAYAAPELWKALPYRGPEVDVWSLGVMLYLLLYGYLPFGDVQDVVVANYQLKSTISSGTTPFAVRHCRQRSHNRLLELNRGA
jgi:serine/threonine protein kinase